MPIIRRVLFAGADFPGKRLLARTLAEWIGWRLVDLPAELEKELHLPPDRPTKQVLREAQGWVRRNLSRAHRVVILLDSEIGRRLLKELRTPDSLLVLVFPDKETDDPPDAQWASALQDAGEQLLIFLPRQEERWSGHLQRILDYLPHRRMLVLQKDPSPIILAEGRWSEALHSWLPCLEPPPERLLVILSEEERDQQLYAADPLPAVRTLTLPERPRYRTLHEVVRLLRRISTLENFCEEDLIVGIGGLHTLHGAGAVAHLLWNRVRLAVVPTTVAAMVESLEGPVGQIFLDIRGTPLCAAARPALIILDPALAVAATEDQRKAAHGLLLRYAMARDAVLLERLLAWAHEGRNFIGRSSELCWILDRLAQRSATLNGEPVRWWDRVAEPFVVGLLRATRFTVPYREVLAAALWLAVLVAGYLGILKEGEVQLLAGGIRGLGLHATQLRLLEFEEFWRSVRRGPWVRGKAVRVALPSGLGVATFHYIRERHLRTALQHAWEEVTARYLHW